MQNRRNKKNVIVALSFITVILFVATAEATNVCGSVSGSWTASNSPYVATCTITINSGTTLTIEAGVTVKFTSGTSLLVDGTLVAVGGSRRNKSISFTSDATNPTAGSWGVIKFSVLSNLANSRLSYVNITYGGASSGALLMWGPDTGSWITIDHLTISNSGSSGINISGGNRVIVDASTIADCTGAGVTTSGYAQVTNSTISSNGTYGINLTGYAFVSLSNDSISDNGSYAIGADSTAHIDAMSSLTLTGNGGGTKNAVGLRGGNTDVNANWHLGALWEILGDITVPSTATLTVDPGVTAKFAFGVRLDVVGTLMANGTASRSDSLHIEHRESTKGKLERNLHSFRL